LDFYIIIDVPPDDIVDIPINIIPCVINNVVIDVIIDVIPDVIPDVVTDIIIDINFNIFHFPSDLILL